MTDFAAIDFETANREPSSVCSVGIVVVRDGEVADSFYPLIRPEPNYYSYWNTQVHGLTWQDTCEADEFPEVWERLTPLIGQLLVPACPRTGPRGYRPGPHLSRRMGRGRATHRRAAAGGTQQPFRRRLPACRLPYVSYGLPRLSLLRHTPCRPPTIPLAPQPPAADRGRGLRVLPREAPSRAGRRRSLCMDSTPDTLTEGLTTKKICPKAWT